ncbi:hypothetical protein HY04_12500 [Kaistella antarctica]|uniref:Uncharacterized protein n=1 Tax=Kaistella antarctica TaxID=266748 RepID=A0ABR4TZ54_9FLAO|nr:hypothetical protein HY04_12500 [Kaistella antarctica]
MVFILDRVCVRAEGIVGALFRRLVWRGQKKATARRPTIFRSWIRALAKNGHAQNNSNKSSKFAA